MATKTISIREEVYDILTSLKKENESFSDVIWRLTKKRKPNLRDYFGGLKDSKAIFGIKEDCKKIRAAEKSSEIMADLLTMGKPVNALDVLIAGIALTNGADKIASTDKRFDEISKVTGLEILKSD